MGKGDLRTKRGKIYRGTHGNSRRRKLEKAKRARKGRADTATNPGANPPRA